jgi:serine protease AprX
MNMSKKLLLSTFFWLAAVIIASAEPRMTKLEKMYDRDGDRIFENLRERMAASKPNEQLPVIIQYKENTPIAGTFAARLNHIQAQQVKRAYHNIPAVAVSMSAKQIDAARTDPWVEHIELDSQVKAAMDTARASFGVDNVRTQFGFTGDGDGIKGNFSRNDIVIAVIDTGVNDSHPDLRGKVLYWKDFISGRKTPYDDKGHGTLVAGVALGTGKKKKKYMGVAPQAALVAIKVLDDEGSGTESDAIAGLDEVLDRKAEFNIRIVNMSLAVLGNSAGRDALSQAANRLVSNGIVVVVAAGNQGPASRTIGAPSAASKVITVGAGADLGEKGFSLASFSGRGPTADGRVKPDLWAPGVRISGPKSRGGYTTANGTSFASPFVAGVVALMLGANPTLTPSAVKKILTKTAQKWAPGKRNSESGFGRLQAYDAVTRAGAITEDLDPPRVPSVIFWKSSITTAEVHNHPFTVGALKDFIAVTAIVYDAPGPGLILELLDPSGNIVARKDDSSRQEGLAFKPIETGVYTLRVTGFGGSTPYLLDISADQN